MNITISRYPRTPPEDRATWPEGTGKPADRWESVIESDDRTWILFVGNDGSAAFWGERDASGGVVGDATVSSPRIRVPGDACGT